MEIFRNTNFDFLGKKRAFIGASLVLSVAGIGSLFVKGGPRYGIDFRGGTVMDVKFQRAPAVEQIRKAMSKRISGEISVQNLQSAVNEVLIGAELKSDREQAAVRQSMMETLTATYGEPGSGKLDLNNSGWRELADRIRDPLIRNGVSLSDQQVQQLAQQVMEYRARDLSGLVTDFNQLASAPGVTPQVLNTLKQECNLAQFTVKGVDIVGPKVGGDLRKQAVLATLYALAGMLVYIAFRFEWIYGVAAVIAVFHDTIITVGLFSLFDKEITLTVIAALLTLVGYSMNDTIVVFDRIRENLKILRREKLESLINKSVNQTLSRTVLTSGLTFLTVVALFLFGGPVLHGFSFALVVGILIGTYSSIFVASPIVIFWQNYIDQRKSRRPAVTPPPAPPVQTTRRGPVKAVK
jgi:preprotein translocase subunit SecF